MAYSDKLANRLREFLADYTHVKEIEKMGGLTFMLNDKVCVVVKGDELLCRIDHKIYEEVLEKRGCREWIYKGKPMKGWVMVGEEGLKTKKDLDYWINLCINFNEKVKPAKRK